MSTVDPAFLAILNAINSARSEAADQQRRNDERMERIENDLKDAKRELNDHMNHEGGQIDTLLDLLKEHIGKTEEWRKKSDQEMAENTAVTKDVKDGQNFVRIATAIVKWVGALALAIGTTWWAVRTVVGGSDIGPGPGP